MPRAGCISRRLGVGALLGGCLIVLLYHASAFHSSSGHQPGAWGCPLLLHTHMCVLNHFNDIEPCTNPGAITCQAPLSMGFCRQEYRRGLPFLLQGIFRTQGSSLCLLWLLHRRWVVCTEPPGKPLYFMDNIKKKS